MAYATRFTVDLSEKQSAQLSEVAKELGTTKGSVLRRMLDAITLPDRTQGQRLCVCQGDRKVSDIAGI